METKQIQERLRYWHAVNAVSLDAITNFESVYQARKYCQCMRIGLFTNVTDLQIWNALQAMRSTN